MAKRVPPVVVEQCVLPRHLVPLRIVPARYGPLRTPESGEIKPATWGRLTKTLMTKKRCLCCRCLAAHNSVVLPSYLALARGARSYVPAFIDLGVTRDAWSLPQEPNRRPRRNVFPPLVDGRQGDTELGRH